MPDDTELLEQRVIKRKQKLEQAATVVSLAQERVASATAADEEAGVELRTLRAALKDAEKKAKRLKKRTQQARDLSGSAEEDRLEAERELAEELKRYEKQQTKLAKAEGALAAALATQRVEDAPPPVAAEAPADAPAGTSVPTKRSATTKKAAPARKRTAAAKKTTATAGRTTTASTSGTTKKSARKTPAKTTAKTTAKTAVKKTAARKTSTRQPGPTT